MIHWEVTQARGNAGFVQCYLCDTDYSNPPKVGEVVMVGIPTSNVRRYYCQLLNGTGLRYFETEDEAKNFLWSFYHLERAS